MEFIKDMFVYILIIVVILLIKVYVITTGTVVGDSMEPSLYDGNILIMEKITHYITPFKRFDIIAFKYKPTSYLIKRIIGLPGEKIEYINNRLYIDDKEIKETFKVDGVTDDFSLSSLDSLVIPDDSYFVLGDNRKNSLDSRRIGFIKKDDIIGKAIIRIWPFNKIKFVK